MRAGKPDHVLTLGDNNYQSGEASTIDTNIGKYYHDFIGNYRGSYGAGSATNRFWPSPGNHDWVATNLKPYTDYFTLPNNERYYESTSGLVHLYAMDSDEHEPDGNKRDLEAGAVAEGQARRVEVLLRPRLLPLPGVFVGRSRERHRAALAVRDVGRGGGAVPGTITRTSASRSAPSRTSRTGSARPASTISRSSALPETKFRYDAKHGAMLITATTTGITFEFWSYDGQKIDSITVPKTCP